MLLSQTAMVKWNKNNKKYFKSKGYIFTKIGDEFEVKVEYLTKGSCTEVLVKCDCTNCKNPYLNPVPWKNYLKYVKDDDKYYCNKCALKLYGKENYRKNRLRNGKSFEQWCIDNDKLNALYGWDYELNDCKPSEINYGTQNKYWFKCPKGLHKSELKELRYFKNENRGGIKCNQCNSFAQWGSGNLGDDFLEKYWDYKKNTVNPWNISYRSKQKVWIKCKDIDYHESYQIQCNSFVNGNRCSYCGNYKVHPLDSVGKLLEDKGLLHIWSEKNKKTSYEYAPFSMKKVYWKCHNNIHEYYYRKISDSNMCEFRCPECVRERNESFLQEKVRLYLNGLGYTVLHEHHCTLKCINPKTKHHLLFDNEVKELNLIIEINGRQHYQEPSGSWSNTSQTLYKRQLYDRYKRMYAKSKGYDYLEIPYWTDNENEEWKNLIDDKIKKTLHTIDN